jgi:hypothetical protein
LASSKSVGAYSALIMGALAPAGFLILEKSRGSLPTSIAFITDVNISGVLSFVLAFSGMSAGIFRAQNWLFSL